MNKNRQNTNLNPIQKKQAKVCQKTHACPGCHTIFNKNFITSVECERSPGPQHPAHDLEYQNQNSESDFSLS
jgi:hypothetical protein